MAAGRVLRVVGTDTLPARGVLVSLHRIARTAQGIVDSARTQDRGQFRFRVRPDTTAVFLVSARHAGIEYFSDPIRPGRDTAIVLVVSDTSSTVPLILSERHVIVGRPEPDGRPVLDLITLANRSGMTRVAADTLTPTWSLRLPSGARNLEVEQGDVSPAAVEQDGDTLRLFAPIPPGRKHLMIGYRLPVEGREFSWLAPADSFDLFVEEERASIRGGGLVAAGPMDLSGKRLQRWAAAPPVPGMVVVRFEAPGVSGRVLLTVLVTVTVLVFAGLVLVLILRGRAGPSHGGRTRPDPLEELVRLDAAYANREREVSAPEWDAYLQRRAALKSAAEATLATHHRRS